MKGVYRLQETMVYTLVFPEDAETSQGKISILAPIRTAMLGYKAGDTFEWDTSGVETHHPCQRAVLRHFSPAQIAASR